MTGPQLAPQRVPDGFRWLQLADPRRQRILRRPRHKPDFQPQRGEHIIRMQPIRSAGLPASNAPTAQPSSAAARRSREAGAMQIEAREDVGPSTC